VLSFCFRSCTFFAPPLKSTCKLVQESPVYIKYGDPKYDCQSIEEWAYAHLIVMTAVKAGVVKPQRQNHGDVIYWCNNFYKLASPIEMGSNDWKLVLKFIIEAENEGIIGSGCAKMFQEIKSNRSEMNVLSTTLVE